MYGAVVISRGEYGRSGSRKTGGGHRRWSPFWLGEKWIADDYPPLGSPLTVINDRVTARVGRVSRPCFFPPPSPPPPLPSPRYLFRCLIVEIYRSQENNAIGRQQAIRGSSVFANVSKNDSRMSGTPMRIERTKSAHRLLRLPPGCSRLFLRGSRAILGSPTHA